MTMRTLYQKCKLVHGDLSEYNILHFEASFFLLLVFCLSLSKIWITIFVMCCVMQGHLYIIDVSQSVDLDHPLALNFLREDCIHVSVCASTIHFMFVY